MKKQVLSLMSVFSLFASSSAMAASEAPVEFTGTITEDQLVQKFCTVRATKNNALTVEKTGADAFKHLFGTTDHESEMATITVNSGKFTPARISVTNVELLKNADPYDDATLSAGFDAFPLDANVSAAVTKKTLLNQVEDQEFDVWFYAKHTNDGTFGEGSYKAIATITCEPGTAEDPDVPLAGAPGPEGASADDQQVALSGQGQQGQTE